MATIKDAAQQYIPNTTHNISELDYVPVDLELKEEKHTDNNGKDFILKYVMKDGIKYRVPNSVLEMLQAFLKKMPNMESFGVIKTGEGMNTKYQVVPNAKTD